MAQVQQALNGTISCERVDFISFYPSMSRDPVQPHCVPVEISFNAFWHCCTNGDVVLVA